MVQLPAAGIVPAVMVILVPPDAALRLWPAQVLLAGNAGDGATVNVPNIVVRLSVKEVMLAAVTAGFVSVMVRLLTSPAAWVGGENALLTLAAVTVNAAVLLPLLVPRLVTNAPPAMVLV